MFIECRLEHSQTSDDSAPKKCCKNIQKEAKQPQNILVKRPKPEPVQLATLQNPSMKFELSYDPTELLGTIFQQMKRVRIERYQSIVVQGKDVNFTAQAPENVEELLPLKMLTTRSNIVDQHNLSVSLMGDIDSYLR